MSDDTEHTMDGKASFDHVYNEADPRPYFHALGEFDYAIPAHARNVFSALVDDRRTGGDERPMSVLDVCCSYGINAALLNHDVTMASLYDRYTSKDTEDLSSGDLADSDAEFYRQRRRPEAVPVIGLDMAEHAVAYGERAGLLTTGVSENLEDGPPSSALARHLADVGLVTITGGVGYVSERTFGRILEGCDRDDPPSVAAFALRWVDYEPYAATLERFGLVTEQLDGTTFPQRRFADTEERAYVLDQLEAIGVDPAGKEEQGEYHAQLFVSRPPDQAVRVPLDELLAGVV